MVPLRDGHHVAPHRSPSVLAVQVFVGLALVDRADELDEDLLALSGFDHLDDPSSGRRLGECLVALKESKGHAHHLRVVSDHEKV
jgi:hypothetical protein